jgi:hypothetical protein
VCALLGVVHIASGIVIPFLLALALAPGFQPIADMFRARAWGPPISDHSIVPT